MRDLKGRRSTPNREVRAAWIAGLSDLPTTVADELNEQGYPGDALVSRYIELLKEAGVSTASEYELD